MRGFDFKRELFNLLAIIHRDGGEYVAVWGIKKAVEDAKIVVSELIVTDSTD